MSDDEGRTALAQAIRTAMEEAGYTQRELGALVAHAEGRDEPYTQAFVSDWLAGRRPLAPDRVFTLERILGARPGSLSRLDGYLPLDAVPTKGVGEAIESAAELTPEQREDLLAQYETMVARTRARRLRRRSPSG